MIEKLSDNSEKILRARYYLNEQEDWPALCHRVVDNVIPNSCKRYGYTEEEIEELSRRMFEHINGLDFIPNSPTMFNAGTEYPMLSACFIIDVPDNLAGIYESVKESALIHKMGGGVGFSLSKLRCKGSKIATTHGSSGGAVSFLKVFANGTAEITAAGKRKGANMAMLRIDHADVEQFIDCKSVEGEIANFNISIQLTDKFMEACKNDSDFDLIDPKDGAVVKTVRALDLMGRIAEGAWRNGEPGICFIDTINKENPTPHLGPITSSNPCQPVWATVLTPDGIRTIGDISIGSIIWSGNGWTKVVNKVFSGIKPVYAFRTHAGTFYGTEEHKVVDNGVKVPVCEALCIDTCVGLQDNFESIDPQDVMDGLVFGDGTYHRASNRVCLIVGQKDFDYFDSEVANLFIEHRPGIKPGYWAIKTSFDRLPNTYNREVPDCFRFGPASKVRGFLRGLYSANGSMINEARVSLKATSFMVIEAVQEMLSSLGITSYYTTNKSCDVKFSNGLYTTKESYDLNIGTLEGRKLFKDLIGFIHKEKNEKLDLSCTRPPASRSPKASYEIVCKELIAEEEEVFDITVDDCAHTYWSAGLLIGNCGEYYSIPYNSCNLSSINLTTYVLNGCFDWDRFKHDIFDYISYLDSIIDANHYPLEKIDDVSNRTRAVGLGVMGFADALIMMNIKYNSEEGFSLARELSEKLSYYSLEASVELVKKRGPYKEFKLENHGYTKERKYGTLDWDSLVNKIEKFGLRNSHTMVIAPTGTIARISNEVSFGIEPIFAKKYTSNILDGAKQETCHRLYQDYLDGKLKVDESVFVCAKEIPWQDHIRMQAEWQKFIHNAISKTVNMPNDSTIQDVYGAYMLAYESGLKGVTVYREGSRKQEVLVDSSKKEEDKNKNLTFEPLSPIKRPLELECDIHHTTVQGEKWVVLVGLMDGRPYEIFGGLEKYIELPKKYTTGLIVKKSNKTTRSRYDLILNRGTEDELLIKDIVQTFENSEHGVVGRLISLSLRLRARPSFLCEQLAKDDDFDFQTYNKVIGRIRKKYIQDGENPESSRGCPECGSSLHYLEGCVSCPKCSWSKCS